jgi:hypothetical protein
MDVLNRKLFANKEARNKLAEMGGIMASSEALMREAQNVPMYAPGGVVNAPDLQKLRSDRSVRDSAERYGMEVDEYIGRMSDGEKRFIASKPKNEVGIDTAGAPDNELTNALATSRMGAKFGGFLDNVGQTGIDVASAALRKTGGTGIKMGARLIIAMSETAAFLGFPEQAAEWQTEAQKEMDYGNKMLDGDIGLFGQDRVGFQVPPETGRLYEAARIEGRATSDAPESVEGPDGYLPASIIQSRRMPTPSGVSADFQMDLMSPSLGNPRNIPSRNEIDIPLPEGSLQPSMSPGGLFMAPAGLSPADKTDRMRLEQNPATMMFAPDGSVIRNQGDLVDPIAEMERAVRAQRADGALTQGGMDSENQIDIFDQTPDELTALKLQSEMNKNPELNSIKVQDSLKAQGARRKIYVPEDPSLFDLETLTRYPGALLNLGSKGIDYLLKSQIGLDENNTPFISGPTKESSLFGKEYPGQESYQKVLDAASTDATANDINDSIFSAGKWAGEKTLDAANSIASSIKNLPEFMTGEGSGGYRGLAENLQKNRPELFTNPELIKPETNDVPPAVTTTTVPPAVTTTTVPVAAPEILATSVADAFAKLGDPAAASKAVLGKILADKAGPESTEPPPSVDDMDIKTRVKTYENLFKEMFDEKDEDKTKEMYLNLAMIGFAVASGTSSNALTNISQGLMQGVTKMNEDRATRTARSDKVKMLALSESLTDERDDKSFDQQLQLAGIKNKGDRQEYLYKSVFETTYKTALEDDPENQQGALDQATRAAVSAAPEAPSALIAVKSTDNGTGGGTPTQKYAVGQVYKIGGKDYTYTGDRTKGNQGFVPN